MSIQAYHDSLDKSQPNGTCRAGFLDNVTIEELVSKFGQPEVETEQWDDDCAPVDEYHWTLHMPCGECFTIYTRKSSCFKVGGHYDSHAKVLAHVASIFPNAKVKDNEGCNW
jgi:hypothetical protein